MSKDSPTLSVSRSSIPARRKMLLARAHFKQVQTNNNSNQHSKPSLRPFAGLSFKTENISVDRIPLPKGWEMISNTIDGKEEIFFRNFENDQNTRQDPRIPIKVHLEELHCQLTTEMISRLNNPSAYNPVNKFILNHDWIFCPKVRFMSDIFNFKIFLLLVAYFNSLILLRFK